MNNDCKHIYQYGGLRWTLQDEWVRYYDWFYCQHCLQNRYRQLVLTTRADQDPLPQALPAPRMMKKEVL